MRATSRFRLMPFSIPGLALAVCFAVVLAMPPATCADTALTNGLVLHYTFDTDSGTNVWDSSGNANHGYTVGAVTYEASEKGGQAPRFSSKNTYVVCPSPQLCMNGWTRLTCAVWVRMAGYTTYGPVLQRMHNYRSSLGTSMGIAVGGTAAGRWGVPGSFGFKTNESHQTGVVSSGTFGKDVNPFPELDRWYHLAGVYDGTSTSFYVDGVLDSNDVVATTPVGIWDETANSLLIGKQGGYRFEWGDAWLNGNVDDVRIYSRGLSSADVRQLYAESFPSGVVTLAVSGDPAQRGTPAPLGYGTHVLDAGRSVTNTVTSPCDESGGTRYACLGWRGTGSIPAASTGCSVVATVHTNSTLTWLWQTEYYLDTEVAVGGTVDVSDGWYAEGTSLTVVATADSNFVFAGWQGDVPSGTETSAVVTVAMDRPRAMTATFRPDATTGEPGLLLHYTFDTDSGTNVWDSSGNGNHGYTIGAVTYEVSEKGGQAPRFSNMNTYVVCPSPQLCMNGWTGLTCAAWVKMKAYTRFGPVLRRVRHYYHTFGGYAAMAVGGTTGGGWDVAGGFSLRTGAASAVHLYSEVFGEGVTPLPERDRWYHLVGTHDGTSTCFYVDGVLDAKHELGTETIPIWDEEELSLLIGKCGGSQINRSDAYLDGNVDDVRIYDRALSSAEIVQLYAEAFPSGIVTLAVSGDPVQHGTPVPLGYGTHLLAAGRTITNAVTSPCDESGGTRYACLGWRGSGSIPAAGAGSSVVAAVHSNSTLTWVWQAEHHLDTGSIGGGAVDVSDGWYVEGTSVTITATADSNHVFTGWLGDVPSGMESSAVVVVAMDRPRALTAAFRSDVTPGDPGLLLHYTFDADSGTNVWDSSGNGNHGYTVGAVTYETSEKGGEAPRFSNMNTYIVCPSSQLCMNGWTGLTCAAWVRMKAYTRFGPVLRRVRHYYHTLGGYAAVAVGGTTGGSWDEAGGFTFRTSGSDVHLYSGAFGRGVSPLPERDRWYHLVGTYDGTGVCFYVDGFLDAKRVLGTETIPIWDEEDLSLLIGKCGGNRINRSDAYLDGNVDDVRIYSRALDAGEVAELAGRDPNDDLVLHYTFDTHDGVTVPDESGTGNDGVVRGTRPSPDGVLYGAREFDGDDDHISCGSDASLQIAGDLTYAAWVRTTAFQHGVIVGRRDGNHAHSIASYLEMSANDDGTVVFGICGDSAAPAQKGWSFDPINDGQWHHVAATYETGQAIRLYIDGQIRDQRTDGIYPSLNSRQLPVYVGSRSDAYFFRGMVDDVRVYRRALDSSEIAALYDAVATGRVSVVINGDPGMYGTPTPFGYGTNWVPGGLAVSAVVASPSPGEPGVRHLCVGWRGTGDVPVSGNTNAVTFAPSQASTLTWIWEPEYRLDVSSGNGGRVDVSDGWYPTGSVVTIAPIPAPGYAFDGWSGTVPAGHETDDPLRVVMDRPRFITAAFYPTNLAAGLRLHYTFDEYNGVSVADESGTGNTGAVHGVSFEPVGIIGGACSFDGADDYIGCGSDASLQITGDLTYAAWIKTAAFQHGVIVGRRNGDSADHIASYLEMSANDDGTVVFGICGDITAPAQKGWSFDPVNDGHWHHVAATYEAGQAIKLYVDGQIRDHRTNDIFTSLNHRPLPVYVGCRYDAYFFDGALDDVRVYDRALSSNDVAELYEAAGPGRVRLVVEVGEGGMVVPGSGLFEDGAEVELTAFPSNGWTFVAWQGDVPPGSQFSNPMTVAMEAPRTIRALFRDGTQMVGLHWSELGTYFPGENAIQCRFYVPDVDELMSLVWTPSLPLDWNLVDAEGDGGPRVLGNEIVFTRRHVREPVEFSYAVAAPAGVTEPQSIGGVATYQVLGMSNPADVTALPDPLVLKLHDEDMHSADYRDHRWVIDAHELSRVLFYWRAGWYRPDPQGFDGYTGCAERYASETNELHSADYQPPHWRITANEANRVLAYWRAGAFRLDPKGLDGYAPAQGVPAEITRPTASPEPPPAESSEGEPPLRVLAQSAELAYDPGGTVVITNVVEFGSGLLALCVRPNLPPGWTVEAASAEGDPEVAHDEILWTGFLPSSPVTVVYTVRIPPTCRGPRQMSGQVEAYVSSSADPTNTPSVSTQLAMGARDADGDGLPDGWEEAYTGGTNSLAPGIDNDGDGLDNRQEWIAGTDPTNAASVLVVTGLEQVAPDKLRVTWQSALDRRYRLVGANDIIGVFAPLQTNQLSTPPANSTDVQAQVPGGLLRVEVGE